MIRTSVKKVGFGFVALALVFSAAAEPTVRPLFTQFGIGQGLPSSFVYQVAQDRAGYLWLATADGLSRYDGVEFTTFRGGREGGLELGGTAVETVFVDSRDRLWVGTEGGGLAVLDSQRRGLRRVGMRSPPHPLAEADVWALGEDRHGRIWAGAYDSGIHVVDPDSLELEGARHDPVDARSPASNHVLSILGTADGWMWLGTSAGLDVVDARGRSKVPSIATHLLAGELILSLSLEPDGSVLAGGRGKIWRIPRDAGGPGEAARVVVEGLMPGALVQGTLRDDAGALWILTRQQGAIRVATDGRALAIAAQPGLPFALSTSELLHGLRDRENNLWFATHGGGLLQVRAGWRNFALLREQSADALPAEAGRWSGASRCPDGDTWLLPTNGPLLRLDRKADRVVSERDGASSFAAWPARDFRALECDRSGSLWLGASNGVVRFDPGSGQLHNWMKRHDYTPLQGLVDLIWTDSDGSVWAATRGAGLTRFERGSDKPQHLEAGQRGLRVVEAEQIGRAPDGSLWVAGVGGIDRMAVGAGEFAAVADVPDGTIHAFAFDAGGSVWLHSREGLLHARVHGAKLEPIARYGPRQGLDRMEIGALVCDGKGYVWLLGGRGVIRLDPRTGEWRRYGAGDGLGVSEMLLRPAQTVADGTTLALSTHGAIEFNPAAIAGNPVAPVVQPQSITIVRDARSLALPVAGGFRLRYDDRDLTMRVRALSLVDPAANRYRFRLEPFDGEWREGGADGSRMFSSLPPGDYRLLAQGANNNGVWGAPVEIGFAVDPPPWRSTAAIVLYAAATLLLAALLVLQQRWRWQRRHALAVNEARREAAERANQAKSDFLADVAHEIRTPISGMSGMADLLSRTQLDARQQRYTSRIRMAIDMLHQLINNLLDLARIESGRLEIAPVPTDACALLQELVDVEAPIAAAKGVVLELECDPALPRWVQVDPLRLRQVLLNLLGNALKFIERGEVRLRVDSPREGWLRLRVEDTGPGMSQDALARLFTRFSQADGTISQRHGGSGLGLVIVRQLVDLMQGRLRVESTVGVGSVFTVELPAATTEPVVAVTAAAPLQPTATVTPAGADTQRMPRAAAGQPTLQPDVPESAPKPRVLLVEDDGIVAEALLEILSRDGFEALHAGNGLAALALLERGRFAAALVDFDLPGLGGLELTRMLRARGSRLPIIGISARSDTRAESDAIGAGMNQFLHKPIDTPRLRESLAAFVDAP